MKKNLINIIIANIVYLFLVSGVNFIVPIFTSVDTYAMIKEYTLYITTYSSILTLGYIQGMYLKYGGKDFSEIKSNEIGKNIFSFIAFMIPIALIISISGIILKNYIIAVLGIGILTTNIQNYYQLLYQAIGDFKSYGTALNASRVLVLLVDLMLIFIFKINNGLYFILFGPIIGSIISIYLTIKINKKVNIFKHLVFSFNEIYINIKNGFVLMIGNFVTNFFSSIDKWFIKLIMNTYNFAMYSFSVSLENVINTFMTPITISMYNYFCKKPSISKIKKIKNCTFIYSFLIISLAFPAKLFIELFMKKYNDSIIVLFPLFAAQAISTIIKGIYINKYKSDGKQKKYLFQIVCVVILSIILNAVLYMFHKCIYSISIATLVTNITWLIICELENKDLRFGIKEIISIIILLFSYLILGKCFNPLYGLVLYILIFGFIVKILMGDTLNYIIKSITNRKKVIKK